MKFYATMGQSHVHSVNGVTVDKDSVVEIQAPDYNSAHEKAFELFGPKFCTVYAADDVRMDYYPRGIVLSL